MNTQLKEPVRRIIELLANQKYSELESLTKGVRLSAQDIAEAVAAYKRIIVVPPENAYDLMDVVEVRGSKPKKWSVTMPLWTKEEGRSDLSIELTIIQHAEDFEIELDDLHVL